MQDVVILGGGLAGLSLALQLKSEEAGLSICVLEKANFPVIEAAHKIGESTVELAAHYFGETLGLKEHIQEHQLPKFGLRFFFGSGDIETRLEVGGSQLPPTPSYQLDRGRFENFLAERCKDQGVQVLEGATIGRLSVSDDETPHAVGYSKNGQEGEVECKWLVDASGRASLLKRQLDLRKDSPHKASAIWFRVQESIRIDDWSEDPDWREGHAGPTARWYSTNHLMGEGYWVWLIPLASGSTSVGIVVDQERHPIRELSSLDKALEWLTTHEPQCAEKILSVRDKVQDFGVLKNYSHDCKRVFSSKRWYLTGEAGVFLDPFYSPGSDFIALSNSFISRLILDGHRGTSTKSKTRFFNNLYLSFYRNTLEIFDKQYPVFGHPQIMPMKIVWDQAVYWALLAYLYFQGKFCDPHEVASVGDEITRIGQANTFMQNTFRDSLRHCPTVDVSSRIDFLSIKILSDLNSDLSLSEAGTDFADKLGKNAQRLEALASEMLAALDLFRGGAGEKTYQEVPPSHELGDFLLKLGLEQRDSRAAAQI